MAKKYLMIGITRNQRHTDDSSAAINKYHYLRQDLFSGKWVQKWDWHQNLVNKAKSGEVAAYSFPNSKRGTLCTIKIYHIKWAKYLKTVPNGNPEDNLSNLPKYNQSIEMSDTSSRQRTLL